MHSTLSMFVQWSQSKQNPTITPTGVFFMYDLSPMMVQLTEHRRSFTHFLTGVCAIVGGVFTVAGMVDGMLYHSTRALRKKIDLGKAT